MKNSIFVLLLLGILWGCGIGKKEVASLTEEVMELHDTAMVKTDDIFLLLSELKDHKQLLLNSDSLLNASRIMEIEAARAMLKRADDGMSDWMHDYQAPQEGADPQKTIAYLQVQKVSILKVADDINKALEGAKAVLLKK